MRVQFQRIVNSGVVNPFPILQTLVHIGTILRDNADAATKVFDYNCERRRSGFCAYFRWFWVKEAWRRGPSRSS